MYSAPLKNKSHMEVIALSSLQFSSLRKRRTFARYAIHHRELLTRPSLRIHPWRAACLSRVLYTINIKQLSHASSSHIYIAFGTTRVFTVARTTNVSNICFTFAFLVVWTLQCRAHIPVYAGHDFRSLLYALLLPTSAGVRYTGSEKVPEVPSLKVDWNTRSMPAGVNRGDIKREETLVRDENRYSKEKRRVYEVSVRSIG